MGSFTPDYRMILDCESKFEGLIWRGDYQQKYIEDITNKAGNFKKFTIFCKMLLAGLKKEESEEISVEFLTQDDLLLLKTRKSNPNAELPMPDHTNADPK